MKTLPYLLIAGHERSGTNWLLEIFNLSPRTFCRNEPYGIDGSPLAALKLVTSPGWVDYVLHHRPSAPVYYNIRHPGGFLNSWASRYLSRRDNDTVDQLNRARLHDEVGEHPHWAERFGDIDAMSVHESDLWYWCYAGKTIAANWRSRLSDEHIALAERVLESSGLKSWWTSDGMVSTPSDDC